MKWVFILLSFVGLCGLLLTLSACSSMGKRPTGERLERMKRSSQWTEKGFRNTMPKKPVALWEATWRFFLESSENTTPEEPVPVVKRYGEEFMIPSAEGFRVTWFGHSSILVEMEGANLLIDPVWGKRASPFSFMGTPRFYDPVIPLEALPPVDVVVVSHDHYDHLDMTTVKRLKDKPITWVVPLGVGSHLEYWGVEPERIVELDWWESFQLGSISMTATPARHDSGRTMAGRKAKDTLWAGWAFKGEKHAIFYSGDTGMHHGFAEIGRRLGPFDLSLMEVGAYDGMWPDNHMGPEQAVVAHRMVKARVMLPVHWCLFNLAQHPWTEPAERVVVAAKKAGVPLLLPRPGVSVNPMVDGPNTVWWPSIPWATAEENPIVSSGMDADGDTIVENSEEVVSTGGVAGETVQSL